MLSAGLIGFGDQQIKLFRLALHRAPGMNSPTDVVLSEWSHSNPTVDMLYKMLIKLKLKVPADGIKQYGKRYLLIT